jgi:hypothetical protein
MARTAIDDEDLMPLPWSRGKGNVGVGVAPAHGYEADASHDTGYGYLIALHVSPVYAFPALLFPAVL